MVNNNLLKGMILGMQEIGAKFVKIDGFDICFLVPLNSKINNQEKLIRAKRAFKETFGLVLKIKRI